MDKADLLKKLRESYYTGEFIDVDRYSMDILRLIHRKYSTDYLSFFSSLSKLYGKSKRKKEVESVISLINEVRHIIEEVMVNGRISGQDSRVLYKGVNEIEKWKEHFADQAEKTRALQKKIDEVSGKTGISIKDLNITKEMVKHGIKRVVEAERKKSLVGRATRGIGRKTSKTIGEFKTAMLGPFAPVIDMLSGATRGLLGMTGLIENEERSRKHRRYKRALEDTGVGVGGGTSMNVESDVYSALRRFFNVGAYKSKWTKDLLKSIKRIGVESEEGKSGLAASAITKLLTLYAATKVAKKTVEVVKEYEKARRGREQAATGLERAARMRKDYIKEVGKEKFAKQIGISVEEVDRSQKKLEAAAEKERRAVGTAKAGIYKKELPGAVGLAKLMERLRHPVAKPAKPEERKFEQKTQKIDTKEIDRIMGGVGEEMDKLSKSVDGLSKKVGVGEENRTIVFPGMFKHLFDSADPLINAYATGNLTVGGE